MVLGHLHININEISDGEVTDFDQHAYISILRILRCINISLSVVILPCTFE